MPQPITTARERDVWLQPAAPDGWRRRAFDLVFGTDTPAGRAFDAALIVAIATINVWNRFAISTRQQPEPPR